jgi:hypothetical protein
LRSLEDWNQPGTKALVGGITFAATTLVGMRAEIGVVRSSDSVNAYQTCVGDSWTNWLTELYEGCKRRWAYQIPEQVEDWRQLREICRQTLDFENYFLIECRRHLLEQTREAAPARRTVATNCLQVIGYL